MSSSLELKSFFDQIIFPELISEFNINPFLEIKKMNLPDKTGLTIVPNGISQSILPDEVLSDIVFWEELIKTDSFFTINGEELNNPYSSDELTSLMFFSQLILKLSWFIENICHAEVEKYKSLLEPIAKDCLLFFF